MLDQERWHWVSQHGHVNGSGHTNGHYVHDTTDDANILILSARDERGCQQMVSDLKAYLEKNKSLGQDASEQLLRNLIYTLGERRTLFQWVAAHQVRLDEDGTLEAAIQALETPRFKPSRRAADRPRIGMVFTIVSFATLTGNPIAGALIAADGGRYGGAQAFTGTSLLLGASFIFGARLVRMRRTGQGWSVKI